ncbi:MAG: hypothetical protein JXR52_12525 [Bacteroidales bacterium]|nr:hypothetical protein [Bacteroidales bacterium]MBN2699643.1 hypothetical protein [Bacteroidales bacterium]
MKIFPIFIALCIFSAEVLSQQPAFPTAEGFGRYAAGGRGGIVVEVTNLQDDGAGSLRRALTTNTNQKRTIVFRVSGTINLESELRVKDDSYITIAGQTAPGEGICLKNFNVMFDNCHDIIVRYLRFRPGDEQDCSISGCDMDALSVRSCQNIILDHCSFSWSIDSDLDLTHETGRSTVQYCILSEALMNSKHSKGAHSMAAGWDGQVGGSYHHNLIASCNSRTPRLDSYAGSTGERDLIDIVNNVIYNWSGYGAYGGENADANWQNNYYRYGPSTVKKDQIFQVDGTCKLYLDGNFVTGYPLVTENNSKGIYILGRKATESELDTILKEGPFQVDPVSMEPAVMCYSSVLAHAGASFPVRDAVDHRIIEDIINRTGAIIDSPSEVGGWPLLNSADAPDDNDHDGMADDWELTAGLDPADPADRNLDRDGDGYTNLEEYINGLIIWPDFIYRPADFLAEMTGEKVVKLSWKDLSDNETGFSIERSGGNGFTEVCVLPANDSVARDTVSSYGDYQYRIRAYNDETASLYSDPVKVKVSEWVGMAPLHRFGDVKVFPNPFKEQTGIAFSIDRETHVTLSIHDLYGRSIAILTDERIASGHHQFAWDGTTHNNSQVVPGPFLLILQSGSEKRYCLIVKQ